MPFSATEHCTEAQWTKIFTELIKPAVEGDPELGYECRRSQPLRGNLVRGIVEDLRDAQVVIADLTDRNPNVFYELGVRHALTDRTILIAQQQSDIPFDLRSYAYHIYRWKTRPGKDAFIKRIRELLRNVDLQPDRADNPVSDFLGLRGGTHPQAANDSATDQRLRLLEEQQLLLSRQVASLMTGSIGADSNRSLDDWIDDPEGNPVEPPPGITLRKVAQRLAATDNKLAARTFARRLVRRVIGDVEAAVVELNKRESNRRASEQINRSEVLPRASEFVTAVLPVVAPLEEFALSCVEAHSDDAIKACIAAAGELFGLEERSPGGIRFATGLPGFLGLRLLLLMGAKAVADGDLPLAGLVLREPIHTRLAGGQVSIEPLWRQRRRFFPEAFLGFSDLPMKHFSNTWSESPWLAVLFDSRETFLTALVTFLVLIALIHVDSEDRELYPGYRLIEGARDALGSFTARLRADPEYRREVSRALGESEDTFISRWARRATALNEAQLGGDYWWNGFSFPTSIQ